MSHRHMPMDVPDLINHPPHYRRAHEHPSGVECIEMVRHMPFCLGNAVKYLYRAGHKGSAAEDYRKAAWYLRKQAEDAWQVVDWMDGDAFSELDAWADSGDKAASAVALIAQSLDVLRDARRHLIAAADHCEQLASEVTP